MKKKLLSILLCISIGLNMLLVSYNPVFASMDWQINGADGWNPAYPQNNQNDYLQDQQTGSATVSQDIVGDSTYPSTYIHSTDSEVAFRIRVNDIDGGMNATNYQFNNFAFVGIDADCNGSVDFFMGIYNPTGNNGRLGIYSADSSCANTSPSTTGISGKPLIAFKPERDINFSIIQATDGSNFNDDSDYFISFKFNMSDIASALNGKSYSFTSTTPFRFMTGTAAQDNSFNQDLNGMEKNGWSSGSSWNSLGVFSDAVTVADGFSSTYCTVVFDKNTGDNDPSPAFKVVASGSEIGMLPSDLTKKGGFYFQGWNTKADGSGTTVTASTVITSSMAVYAQWSTYAIYTVTFNYNYSGSPNNGVYATAITMNGIVGSNMPADPTQPGNSFNGWSLSSSNTTNLFDSSTSVTGNMPVYASWVPTGSVKTPVKFFSSDGSVLIASVYPNGNSTNYNSNSPIPTKAGYTFLGWSTTANGSTVSLAKGAKIGNNPSVFTYYAIWQVAVTNYTLTFNANGGTLTDVSSRTVTNSLFGTMPSAPTRSNYVFVEWNRNAAGTGETMYPTSIISATTTVYAIWKEVQTVTFDANGGKFDNSAATQTANISNGSLLMLPQPPLLANNTFLGWSTSSGASTPDVNLYGSAFTLNEILYAVWSPIHNVTFNPNRGSWNGDSSTQIIGTAYGSVLYMPDNPTRTGYTFKEWSTNSSGNGGTKLTMTMNIDADITVYAIWTPLPETIHTVSFETNGGSSVDNMTTDQIDTEPVSTQIGYTLEGWYTDSGLTPGNKVSFPYDVTEDIILYAKWTANTYTVTLNDNGGGGGSGGVAATYGQSMPAAEAPSREGYTFIGYFDKSTDGMQYYDADMNSVKNWDKTGANDILYAQWEANNYVVTFDANGGQYCDSTTSMDIEQTYGSKYILPDENPTMNGYTFASWNTQEDGKSETITKNTDITITAAETVYAIWAEEGNVIINYNVNNTAYGSVSNATESLNPETGTPGGSEATAKEGYHFVEWQDSNGSRVSENPVFIPEKVSGSYVAETYTAVFAPNTDTAYTVEHYVMDTDGTYQSYATDSLTGTTDDTLTLADLIDDSLLVQNGITYDHGAVDGINTDSTDIKPDSSLVIKLYYARSQYVLTLNTGTGASDATGGGIYYYGQEVNINVTVDSSCSWDKWESSNPMLLADQADQNASFEMPAGDVALTARAMEAAVTYNITYNLNGGTITDSNPATYTSEDEDFTLNNPTKAGFDFAGWTGTGLEGPTMTVSVVTGSTGNRNYTATWAEPETSNITGDVEDNNSNPLKDAVVTIKNGTTIIMGPQLTDVNGKFLLVGVPYGTYNLVIEYTENGETTTVTQIITVDTANSNVGTITMPVGSRNSIFIPRESIPVNVIGGLDQQYDHINGNTDDTMGVTLNDMDEVNNNAGKITVTLKSNELVQSQQPQANAVRSTASASDKTIGCIFDLTATKLLLDVNGNTIRNTTLMQLNSEIAAYIDLPPNMQGKQGYQVYRYHDGGVDTFIQVQFDSLAPVVDGTFAINGNQIITYTNKFSVYAIAYNNTPQPPSGGGSDGDGTNYFTITFDVDGGTPSSVNQSVANGDLLTMPVDPIRDGYSFEGWYKADGSKWRFDTDRVYSDITLTAKWIIVNLDAGIPALDKVNHFAYMQGYPDQNFSPQNNMTRAEAIVMFARLLAKKMDVDKVYPCSFKDVKATKWYANAIGYMEQYGIIKGYADGTFKPEAPITRAEFAAITSRFDSLVAGEPNVFSDVPETSWARDYISFAAAKGWIKGNPDGTFKPQNYITRAEVVTLVNRMLERYCDKNYISINLDALKHYLDLTPAYWAYYGILEASNGHKYEKKSDSETWLSLTK